MTAGASSCSCDGCGAVCTGRFRGCVDVWDKGPRHVAARRPGSSHRLDTAPAGDNPDGAPPAPDDQLVPSGDMASDLTSDMVEGTGMSVVLNHLFERVEALETVTAPDSAGAGTGTQAESDAIAAIADQVQHLTAGLGNLDALGRRVGALEQAVTAAPDVAVQLRSLEEVAERTVDELDQHRVRTVERLDELAHGLERLSDRLQPLSTIPDRVEALERTAGEAIDALDQRLRGFEKTVADFGPGLEDLAGEVVGLGRLAARVEVLEQAEEPVTVEALDAVHTRIERLSDRTDAVEVLPQQVDALERTAFGGGPVHHRSRSMVADLDALGSQVEVVATAVDGVRRRLADVEVASARTEALERGLAGAIDMIDQLVAQIGALEWACRPLPPPDDDEAAG